MIHCKCDLYFVYLKIKNIFINAIIKYQQITNFSVLIFYGKKEANLYRKSSVCYYLIIIFVLYHNLRWETLASESCPSSSNVLY